MYVLGINAYHPDASVALIKDGNLVWAAEEERFNRIKHSSGFPAQALVRCLQDNRLSPDKIDWVAISKDPYAQALQKILFSMRYRPGFKLFRDRARAFSKARAFHKDFFEAAAMTAKPSHPRFINVEHHLAHAASSFYFSGFKGRQLQTIEAAMHVLRPGGEAILTTLDEFPVDLRDPKYRSFFDVIASSGNSCHLP